MKTSIRTPGISILARLVGVCIPEHALLLSIPTLQFALAVCVHYKLPGNFWVRKDRLAVFREWNLTVASISIHVPGL